MWPDRNAPGRDEDVCLEAALQRVAVRVLVVGDRAQPFDRRPGRRKLRIDEDAVHLVDLTWLERLPRTAKLAPGREHGGPRPLRNASLGDAGRR